jgi:outer membrane protein OmpA-like peptidoglycan-associated protein
MKKITFIVSVLIALPFLGLAQKSPQELKAEKFYTNLSFTKAAEKYEGIEGLSTEGVRNLANSYRYLNNYEKAEEQFLVLTSSTDNKPEDIYLYAEMLKMNGKHSEGEKWMDKFHELNAADHRGTAYFNSHGTYEKLKKDKGQFTVANLEVNSPQEDFGAVFYKNQVVFATSREGTKSIRRKWNWNQLPFLDLYVSDRESNGSLSNIVPLSKKINGKFHEGPASFTADGLTMVYTTDDYDGKSSDGTIRLQLKQSIYDGEKWGSATSFDFNDHEYSCGHAALSADGGVMYFASDMPGGIGGVDIYKTTKQTDGSWSKPENLGVKINTEGNESFPYIQTKENLLFFASDGHVGLGGLDVFVVKIKEDGKLSKIQNVGVPVNSERDDFSLVMDANNKYGYFSSNREGGKGDDDIYSLTLLKAFVFGKTIKGLGKDKDGNVLAGVSVSLFDASGAVVETVTTGPEGAYSFTVEADKEWKLAGSKEKYFEGSSEASTATDEDVVIADVELEKDPGLSLLATVTDAKTKGAIPGVSIKLIDNFSGKEEVLITDENGSVMKPLADKKLQDRGSFNLEISKEGYFTKTVTYNTEFDKEGQYEVHKDLDMSLDPLVKDLSVLIEINPINFDLGRYNIRPDAALELDKIVAIMNKYPTMVVELGAHTDCRGSIKSNKSLSAKRAKSSAKYIQKSITNPERIYGKGYGESILLNDCACEGRVKSDCDEATHSLNRRTEFKVISTGDDKVKVK